MIYMKVLILGCGKILDKHYKAIEKNGNKKFKIVGLCDKNADTLNKLKKKFKIKVYKNFVNAIKETRPDIVSILLPSGMHAKYVKTALKLNVHVIVEKPMCLRLKDSSNIIGLSKKYNKNVFVVMQNKFNLPVEKLMDDIKKKKLGRIFHGSVIVRWRRDQFYYNQSKWRGTWKYDGGVVSNQASHHLDLLRSIMGEPLSVFAKNFNHLAKIEAEDTSLILFKFKNNKSAIMEATTATRPKNLEGSITILGSKGSAKIGGFALNEISFYNLNNKSKKINLKKYHQKDLTHGHYKFYDHVFNCLKYKRKSQFSAFESHKTIKLINAIYRSSETSKEIFLKDNINSKLLGR